MRCIPIALAASLGALAGCATGGSLHDRMSRAAHPGDGLQQTQLAHLGHVETVDGRFEVCFQRLVLEGMLAPRGQSKLLLFTAQGDLDRSYDYPDFEHDPLWCEAGRVYLRGFTHVPGIPIDPSLASHFSPDELPTGNVIDFSQAPGRAMLTREKRYGSSGGIDDEVWPSR